jgi:poly-gamma-glutamate capsule biosynthesis protein CapA/YwtB (metallophosphatase superfamily)
MGGELGNNTLRIQWLGDLELAGGYCDPGFRKVLAANVIHTAEQLTQADLRIANWEAPLIGAQGLNPSKKFAIHTTEETARVILPLKIDVGLMANNHAFDCLDSGLTRTASFLESAGMRTVGAGTTQTRSSAPLLLNLCGIPFAILNYVDGETNPGTAFGYNVYVNMLEPHRALKEVRYWSERKHVVLVNCHWGIDFIPMPPPQIRKLARDLVDAGATVVVGHHTHCLQGYERRGRGVIFYSLGTFMGGGLYPWPKFSEPTAAVTCEIRDGGVKDYHVQSFLLRDKTLSPDPANRASKMMNSLSRPLAKEEAQYARSWSMALAYNVAVFRPLHFIQRKKNPLKMLASLEKRHIKEYFAILKQIVRNLAHFRKNKIG